MRHLPFIILALALVIAIPVHAQTVTFSGNDLYEMCQSSKASCQLYISGFIHGAAAAAPEKLTNIPGDITGFQATDIVIKYLASYPASRHLDASLLIFAALFDAFPQKVARSEN